MGLPSVLETIIGLVFIYFLISMLCSGINELIAQQVGRRGVFLREGLINLVSDRWLYLRVINHPLVSSLYRGVPGRPRTPSYIPSANFADALIDNVMLRASQLEPSFAPQLEKQWTVESLRMAAQLCKRAGYTVGDAILPLLDVANDDTARARHNIEAWFESAMDRVGGWYKQSAQRILLVLGIVVAVLFNVDTLQIATQLGRSADLRKSLADAASQVVETKRFNGVPLDTSEGDVKIAQADLKKFATDVTQLNQLGLPIGFACMSPTSVMADTTKLRGVLRDCWGKATEKSGGWWLIKIIGWLITGLAVALGAPFWFDLLNKLANLRGSGPKPAAVPQTETMGATPSR